MYNATGKVAANFHVLNNITVRNFIVKSKIRLSGGHNNTKTKIISQIINPQNNTPGYPICTLSLEKKDFVNFSQVVLKWLLLWHIPKQYL